jgi:hypothetical protein
MRSARKVAAFLLALLGIARGAGGLLLLTRGRAAMPEALADDVSMRVMGAGLVAVACLAWTAAWRLWHGERSGKRYMVAALALFVCGGLVNGALLFGNPTDKGTLVNLAVATVILLLALTRRSTRSTPPTLVLDFDGVLCDSNVVKSEWIRDQLGLEIPPRLCDRSDCVTLIAEGDYDRAAAFAYEREGTLRAAPIVGAPEAVAELARDFRLVMLTARPTLRLGYAAEWLAAQGMAPHFSELRSCTVEGHSKIAIVRALGAVAFVDDDERHLGGTLAPLTAFHFGHDATPTAAIAVRDWATLRPLLLRLADAPAPGVAAP